MPTGLVSIGQSGMAQTRSMAQVARTWEETYPPLRAGTDPIARAFLEVLAFFYRDQTSFTVSHLGQMDLGGTGGGAPIVNGAGQTGYVLTTSGWPATATVLKAGDVFTIAGLSLVYDVTADVTSDGSGNASIPLNPPLIGNTATSAPANGAALTINSTPGAVQYTCFIESLEMPQASAGPGYYQGCRVRFREVRATSLVVVPPTGFVVIPPGTYLAGTLPGLAGGGAGLPTLSVRMRFLVDSLLAAGTANGMFWLGGAGGDSIAVTAIVGGGDVDFRGTFTDGVVGWDFGSVPQSALPAAGTGVILYAVYQSGSGAIVLTDDEDNVLFVNTITSAAIGTGNTPPAFTTLHVADGSHGSDVGGLSVDGVEVTSAVIALPGVKPLLTDPGSLGLYGFTGSGASSAGGGGTLTQTKVNLGAPDVSYFGPGLWDY
jgi:hypothetical protein